MTADKYRDALATCPAPGEGRTHSWMLGTANHAAFAGVDAATAEREMADALGPRGAARRAELRAAVEKAYKEHGERGRLGLGALPPPPKPRPAPMTFRAYVEAGADFKEGDCWEASPVRLTWEPGWEDAVAFLRNLFLPADWVFCGETETTPGALGRSVRRRDEWVAEIARRGRAGEALPERVCVNPVSPTPAKTKGGKDSLRCDASVVAFRNLVVESDNHSFPLQLAFWGGWGAKHGWERVRALIHTGGKSVHCVFRVDAVGRGDWEMRVRGRYVREVFGPMGFDTQNDTPFRMTRLPGAVRMSGTASGKPTMQKLLFLNTWSCGRE